MPGLLREAGLQERLRKYARECLVFSPSGAMKSPTLPLLRAKVTRALATTSAPVADLRPSCMRRIWRNVRSSRRGAETLSALLELFATTARPFRSTALHATALFPALHPRRSPPAPLPAMNPTATGGAQSLCTAPRQSARSSAPRTRRATTRRSSQQRALQPPLAPPQRALRLSTRALPRWPLSWPPLTAHRRRCPSRLHKARRSAA